MINVLLEMFDKFLAIVSYIASLPVNDDILYHSLPKSHKMRAMFIAAEKENVGLNREQHVLLLLEAFLKLPCSSLIQCPQKTDVVKNDLMHIIEAALGFLAT